ncbi:hypothetical protein P4S72_26035, partial [Vibrio sp. PP-XX7]
RARMALARRFWEDMSAPKVVKQSQKSKMRCIVAKPSMRCNRFPRKNDDEHHKVDTPDNQGVDIIQINFHQQQPDNISK